MIFKGGPAPVSPPLPTSVSTHEISVNHQNCNWYEELLLLRLRYYTVPMQAAVRLFFICNT